MAVEDIDHRVRLATFAWIQEQTALHGEVLPRGLLARGFEFDGQRVPLSITTVPIVKGRRRGSPALPLSWHRPGASGQRRAAVGHATSRASRLPAWHRAGALHAALACLHRRG